jgi:hypothetical protein
MYYLTVLPLLTSFSPVRRELYFLAANQGESESFTLKMDMIWSSEPSLLTTNTRHLNIPEDNILHRLRLSENRALKL